MRRRLLIAFIGSVLLLGFWAFYRMAVVASRGGESAPLFSNRRYDPYGAAAFGELLQERRVPFRTLERPRLEEDDRGVLIQVLRVPQRLAVSIASEQTVRAMGRRPQVQLDSLKDWIAAGNTVIQLTRSQTDLMGDLGVTALDRGLAGSADSASRDAAPGTTLEHEQSRGRTPDELAWPLVSARWTEAGRKRLGEEGRAAAAPLVVRSPSELRSDAPSWRPLATLGGRVVAGEVCHGQGRLIVVSAPTPILNGAIAQGGNLDFLLALVGRGPVILDEWSHGIGQPRTTMGLIRKFGLMPVLAQLLLVLALYTWSTCGHRRPDREGSRRRRSIAEEVETLGYLYRQTLSREETARRVWGEVRRRMADVLRCTPEELESGSAKLKPEEAAKLHAIEGPLATLLRAPRSRRWHAELAKTLAQSHAFAKEKSNERRQR